MSINIQVRGLNYHGNAVRVLSVMSTHTRIKHMLHTLCTEKEREWLIYAIFITYATVALRSSEQANTFMQLQTGRYTKHENIRQDLRPRRQNTLAIRIARVHTHTHVRARTHTDTHTQTHTHTNTHTHIFEMEGVT